jgi:hypothetical protein
MDEEPPMTTALASPASPPALDPAYAESITQRLSDLGVKPVGIVNRQLVLRIEDTGSVNALGPDRFVETLLDRLRSEQRLWESIDSINFT